MDKNIKHNFNYILTLLLLSIMAYFSIYYTPIEVNRTKEIIDNLSKDIEGWRYLKDITMDYQKYQGLDPNALIFRDYIRDGNVVNLVVVYHQNNRWGAHDPTVCYTSQGWDIKENKKIKKITLNNGATFKINSLIVKKGNIKTTVYYFWFSSNKKLTESRNKQMFDMVLNGLVHGFTESGFVRISVAGGILNMDSEEILESFINAFLPVFKNAL